MRNNSPRFARPALWLGAAGIAISLVSLPAPAGAQRGGGDRASARSSVHDASRNTNANQNVNRNTNVNQNVNRNTNVNQNVNVNRNVDVNVHHDDHYDRWGHPVAAVAGAVAVGTAVAMLPTSGCSGVAVGGVSYQHCGSSYYQPVYSGSSVTYVVVNPPQ